MEKYLLDDEGNILLDDSGKKVLNPEWVAANPNYQVAADEVDESDDGAGGGGDYEPDARAMAWHEKQVEGLKRNQSKALSNNAKNRKRADDAESELATVKAELQELRDIIGDTEGHDLKERLAKLKQFEAGALDDKGIDEDEILERGRKGAEMRLQPQIDAKEKDNANLRQEIADLRAELHKFKYDGRIQSASIGVLKKGYENIGLAALKTMIREDDEGELVCYDADGELAIDSSGLPLKPEEFVQTTFRKAYPDLCVKDAAPDVNGSGGPGGPKKAPNPFSKDTLNRTAQFQLIKNDPDKARKLMRAAGYDAAKISRMMG